MKGAISSSFIILAIAVGAIQSLSPRRATNQLRRENSHTLDDKDIYVEKDDTNYKASTENELYGQFKSLMVKLFKRFEDDALNNALSEESSVDTSKDEIVSTEEETKNNKINNDLSRFLVQQKKVEGSKNIKVKPDTSKWHGVQFYNKYNNNNKYYQYENKNKELYFADNDDKANQNSNNEGVEIINRNENDDVLDEEKFENEEQDENLSEDEDDMDLNDPTNYDENNEEYKDEEFGVLDYLAASKDSEEGNEVQGSYKNKDEISLNDEQLVADDYFDNSDYEA